MIEFTKFLSDDAGTVTVDWIALTSGVLIVGVIVVYAIYNNGVTSVVMGVTEDLRGIGYSGIGYRTSGVKAIALSMKDGDPAYEPTYENVLNGKYPLSRMLYIYVVKKPNEPLPPLVGEFIRYVLSREGQQVVVKDGYLPLPAKISERQVARLN